MSCRRFFSSGIMCTFMLPSLFGLLVLFFPLALSVPLVLGLSLFFRTAVFFSVYSLLFVLARAWVCRKSRGNLLAYTAVHLVGAFCVYIVHSVGGCKKPGGVERRQNKPSFFLFVPDWIIIGRGWFPICLSGVRPSRGIARWGLRKVRLLFGPVVAYVSYVLVCIQAYISRLFPWEDADAASSSVGRVTVTTYISVRFELASLHATAPPCACVCARACARAGRLVSKLD